MKAGRELKQRAILTLAATAVLVGGTVAMGGPASAASSPYEACGGGSYRVIDHHDLGAVATIYLLYNGSTDCVVTWKKAPYAGSAAFTRALVHKKGAIDDVEDYSDSYRYYAGPVKVSAPGVCIEWGGEVDPGDLFWNSGWSHCG
jgi:hypothetical protein